MTELFIFFLHKKHRSNFQFIYLTSKRFLIKFVYKIPLTVLHFPSTLC